MNHDEANLQVTLAQLSRMYEALGALTADRARVGDTWYAVMSEGLVDEIRRLEATAAQLSGLHEAEHLIGAALFPARRSPRVRSRPLRVRKRAPRRPAPLPGRG